MSWREFSYLINGLSSDTPLGRIVTIRSENDPEQLKEFTPDMKRIRSEYLQRRAKTMDKGKAKKGIEEIRQALFAIAKRNEET